MRTLKAVDLFCGAGGLSEGLRQAGYRVVGAVELDPLACSAYRANHPDTRLLEKDISKVSGVELLRELKLGVGKLDLLAACPPCQGYSTMRTRNGGKRNRDPSKTLILQVLRLARSMRPKSVMIENVPGLEKSRKFASFCRGLKSLGYQVEYRVLNTALFGVPQRRKRLVLLASSVATPSFADPTPLSGMKTVRSAIGHLRRRKGRPDPLHDYEVRLSDKVKKLVRQIPRNGGSRSALHRGSVLECHKNVSGFKDVYGRMSWDKPAPTITGGCINPSKGRFLHPSRNRAITLREAALLQTFPSSYQFPLERGRYAAALLIGNALPPEFIRRHAQALRGAIG